MVANVTVWCSAIYICESKNSKVLAEKSGVNRKKTDKDKGIQCFECEGFSHVQREFPNFLRRKKISLMAQHDDTKSEGKGDDQVNCLALTTYEASYSDTYTEITEESIIER